MELREFLKKSTKRERFDLAISCGTSVNHLYQIAGKHRYASPHLATRIEIQTRLAEAATDGRLGAVPRASMVRHPEIFFGPIEDLWKRLGIEEKPDNDDQ